jgi:hypothetical protein
MAMSAAAQWLQQALLDLCSDSHAALQLDPEVVSSLVSYCEIAPPDDAQQYLFVSHFPFYDGCNFWNTCSEFA